MGSLVLAGATSGSTTITPTDAVTATVTLPSTGGTLQTSGSGFTTNGVAYASSTSALTTGSALVFDGTNLGVGVTPSAWTSASVAQLGAKGSVWQYSGGSMHVSLNAYSVAGSEKYIQSDTAADYYQYAGGHFFRTAASGTAGNAITWTTGMTLDSSGNVTIGNTTGTSYASKGFNILGGLSNSQMFIGHASGTNSGESYIIFTYNGSGASGNIGSITQNGTTGVLYNLTSDYRLKNNPVALTGAKDFVMALQPKTWDWWDDSGKGVGFIAHEFMEVAKYSGHGEKDEVDENGNPKYQSIQPSSSEVMANLVAFIQELSTLITAQQSTIQSLTERITALEGART